MELRTNFSRFKEPRGFIKILQFIIAILAFATTGGYYSEFKIEVTAPCNVTANTTKNVAHNELVKFGYPFKDLEFYSSGDIDHCTKLHHDQHKFDHDYKSESEFFVFVGVVTFLYCVVAMVYYVVFEDPARYGPGGANRVVVSFATVDLLVTLVLVLFWFAGSIAWAVGVGNMKTSTDVDKYIKDADECNVDGASCKAIKEAGYAALTISLLFGFLSFFLWAANIWFVFKETIWHKEFGATATAEQPSGGEIPRQEVPKQEDIP